MRLQQLEDAVESLRKTRHRRLALRAELALAKAGADRERLWPALEALRQFAVARDDYDLVASVFGDAAEQAGGEDRLGWLETQAEWLERAGRYPSLVRNWWNQAELLWPELGRRAEARSIIQRVARAQRALPTFRDRLLLLAYRFRLWFALDEQRLVHLGIWGLGPLLLWVAWRLGRWTATWFWRLPFLGVTAYLIVFFFTLAGIFLLSEGLGSLTFRRRHSEQASQGGDIDPAVAELPMAESGVESDAIGDGLDPGIPGWALSCLRSLTRINRIVIRVDRLGRGLGLDRLPASLAWCSLSMPVGIGLTAIYWRASGCSRIWLLPLGLAGQLLALEGLFGFLWLVLGKRPARRGRVLRYACLLGLIRLKRRLFGRRPHVPHRTLAARGGPQDSRSRTQFP